MKTRSVLISGAGIAGPALALELNGLGCKTTVVERAAELRVGGQAVDFRGPVHREVLERMKLWEPIHQARTRPTDVVMIGRGAKEVATLPAVMMSGDVEIVRGDLTRLIYDRTRGQTTYRFGDHVARLEQTSNGVKVGFAKGDEQTFDLVVGADGLHSKIRSLVFGPESKFLRHHGYRVATFSVPNVLNLRQQAFTYTVPGRAMMVQPESNDRVRATFIFCGKPLSDGDREPAAAMRMLDEVYRDAGWEVPRVLAELPKANDLYVDQIGTIAIDRYSSGRVALLGDAAYGGTIGGQGTSLAIVGAHVLARELAAADGDPGLAFARYEDRMRPYATPCQKGAERCGGFFAPRTRFGLLCRNLFYAAFTSKLLIKQFEKIVKASATAFELPAYS